jgi:3-phytase
MRLKSLRSLLLILFAGVLAFVLVLVNSSATLGNFTQFDDKSNKKEGKEKKKSKSDDDDDDDDDDKGKKEKTAKPSRSVESEPDSIKAVLIKSEKGAKSSKSSEQESHSTKSVSTKSEKAGEKTAAAPSSAASGAMETVNATVETDPVPHGGDAADDPAIWIHPSDPSKSTIIGTDKQGGIAVYDLSGKQIQYLPAGLLDNVDLRDGFELGGQQVSIVTASNRKDNTIAIYKINPQSRMLENAAARAIKHTASAYGMCMYRSAKTGKIYYFGTSKSGSVEQWELFDQGGKVDAKKVRSLKLGSTVEGCVADDELGHFYVAEEAIGIWKFGAEPDAGDKGALVDKVGSGHLVADVEGLAIAYGKNGEGYLMVSSQGNHSYVVYKREGNNEFVKKFRITNGGGIDGAEETDGIDVTTANLGPSFPHGVFIVQDGFNDKGNQNFKLVPLQKIIK